MPAHAYRPMMDLVTAGALRPDRLITRTIGLAEAPAALTAMDTAPATGVTVIHPG
jgi:threonine dehydrogenase-like Zn-dependent dehydrogenase